MRPAEPGGEPLLELVRRQVELGPRYPGSEAHRRLTCELGERLEEHAAEVHRQDFTVRLPGGPVECANLTGIFRPGRKQRASPGRREALLLGTHFDTRLTADRESDAALRARPIPGANDGGSGTAILLSLLPELARLGEQGILAREVRVVFFDAEDVGGIAGLPFSLGAWHYARESPLPPPGEVLVLDMVGGKGLELDVDGQALEHPPSLGLTRRVFAAGRAGGPRRVPGVQAQTSDQRPLSLFADGHRLLPADRPGLPRVAHPGRPAGGHVGALPGYDRSSRFAVSTRAAALRPSWLLRSRRSFRVYSPRACSSGPKITARGMARFSAYLSCTASLRASG